MLREVRYKDGLKRFTQKPTSNQVCCIFTFALLKVSDFCFLRLKVLFQPGATRIFLRIAGSSMKAVMMVE
jgi:hypothetical protein